MDKLKREVKREKLNLPLTYLRSSLQNNSSRDVFDTVTKRGFAPVCRMLPIS